MQVNKLALIDMDGTLANYDDSIRRVLDLLKSPNEPHITDIYEDDQPWIQERINLIKKQPNFWRNLEKIEEGFRVVDILKNMGYELMILTKGPVKTTRAWTEKRDWCHTHLPGIPVTITENKGLVYGKVLFDDFPPYIEKWLEFRPRGKVLMLDHPYNSNFNPNNVFRVKQQTQDEEIISFLLS